MQEQQRQLQEHQTLGQELQDLVQQQQLQEHQVLVQERPGLEHLDHDLIFDLLDVNEGIQHYP